MIRKLLKGKDFETLTDIYDYLLDAGGITSKDVTEFLFTQNISPQEILNAWASYRLCSEIFWGINKFTSYTIIPKDIHNLGSNSFYDSNVQKVSCEGVVIIGHQAFSYSKLSSIEMPIIQTVKSQAFKGCNNLTQIELPESLVEIGEDAFNGCYNLLISIPRKSLDKVYPPYERAGIFPSRIPDILQRRYGGKQWVVRDGE